MRELADHRFVVDELLLEAIGGRRRRAGRPARGAGPRGRRRGRAARPWRPDTPAQLSARVAAALAAAADGLRLAVHDRHFDRSPKVHGAARRELVASFVAAARPRLEALAAAGPRAVTKPSSEALAQSPVDGEAPRA